MSTHPTPAPAEDPAGDGVNAQADQQLSNLLHQHLQRHEPSAQLRAGIRAQVALQAAAQTSAMPTALATRAGGSTWVAWRSASAGLVCGVALTLAAGLLWLHPPGGTGLENALLASHVHALGAGPLFQVASSDRHTVKPWFQGKLDFAPPVPDLAAADYPLLGGRLETLDGRTVAALVYAHRKHNIDVYIWPDEQTRAPEMLARKGFHLSHWSEGGMQVWVVADADAAEVARFGQAWRDGAAAGNTAH